MLFHKLVKKYVGRLSTQTELFGTLMRAEVEHVLYEKKLENLIERMNEYYKEQDRSF